MNSDGVSGGPITQALIPGRSLRVRSLRNKTGIQKSVVKSDQGAFETVPGILTPGKNYDSLRPNLSDGVDRYSA